MTEAMISGGYILLARKLLDNGIISMPHLFLKLWIYCLLNALWKDHGTLKRGQLFTSIDRLRNALSYKIGYRMIKPSIKEIRAAYEFLAKGTMIGITKVTHGMIITILNYDAYQNIKNYVGHYVGHTEGTSEGTIYKKEGKKNIKPFLSNSDEVRLAELLLEKILSRNPNHKKPNLQTWAKDIDLMIRIDTRTPEDIRRVIEWSQNDQFWQSNILSTAKLRKQFDQIWAKMGAVATKGSSGSLLRSSHTDATECRRCGKRIIVRSDLIKDGCVYCEAGSGKVRT